MMIKMVVFDMAGTTVNEQNVVYRTLREVIIEEGVSVDQETVNLLGAGKEKLQAIIDILNYQGHEVAVQLQKQLHDAFLQKLSIAYQKLDVQPMPGAEEVFSWLKAKDIKVVLNTGYNRQTALSLLKKLGWETGFQIDGLVTASEVQRSRPHPDMIHLAQARFQIESAQHILKIGDSKVDIEEGKNAGCGYSIGITTGAQKRETLAEAQPDAIVDHLSEIRGIIEKQAI